MYYFKDFKLDEWEVCTYEIIFSLWSKLTHMFLKCLQSWACTSIISTILYNVVWFNTQNLYVGRMTSWVPHVVSIFVKPKLNPMWKLAFRHLEVFNQTTLCGNCGGIQSRNFKRSNLDSIRAYFHKNLIGFSRLLCDPPWSRLPHLD